jgi:hypothetical protein
LKNCGITILEILPYTVFAILDSKTAVIDKICLWYYGIENPPMPPSWLCVQQLHLGWELTNQMSVLSST